MLTSIFLSQSQSQRVLGDSPNKMYFTLSKIRILPVHK